MVSFGMLFQFHSSICDWDEIPVPQMNAMPSVVLLYPPLIVWYGGGSGFTVGILSRVLSVPVLSLLFRYELNEWIGWLRDTFQRACRPLAFVLLVD